MPTLAITGQGRRWKVHHVIDDEREIYKQIGKVHRTSRAAEQALYSIWAELRNVPEADHEAYVTRLHK